MSKKPASGDSRRRLLQLLAVGGVFTGSRMLPEGWIKPVVGEVVLPAHAQMSPVDGEDGPDTAVDSFPDSTADNDDGP